MYNQISELSDAVDGLTGLQIVHGIASIKKMALYKVELNKTEWILQNRYKDLIPIGAGAFGQVCRANDIDTGEVVAIKKLTRPFQSFEHAKRTYREIKLLTFMNHENIIDLVNFYTPESEYANFTNLYLVFPYVGHDLSTHIRAENIQPDHIPLIIYQILLALKYVHSAGLIHRDLKPSNIVMSENVEIQLIDFGLARHGDEEMTGYVSTRWWRAPEILFNWMHYTSTADIWSLGCIMAELYSGQVLFRGDDTVDQLRRICRLLGKPSRGLIERMTSENAQNFVSEMKDFPKADIRQSIPEIDQDGLDLLKRMLDMDPDARVDAAQCLQHPFFGLLRDPDDEPVSAPFHDPEDTGSKDAEVWRKLVYDLIQERQGS